MHESSTPVVFGPSVDKEVYEAGSDSYNTTAGLELLPLETAAPRPSHQELNCRTFTFVVYVVLFGSMVLFGLVGNTLSFIVLQFDRHSHAATFLLQVR